MDHCDERLGALRLFIKVTADVWESSDPTTYSAWLNEVRGLTAELQTTQPIMADEIGHLLALLSPPAQREAQRAFRVIEGGKP